MEISLERDSCSVERETQYTLVGKILTEKMLNRRGIMGVLQSMWLKKEVKVIKEMSVNLYAISFTNKQSMEKALEKGPWSVMVNCLNLKKWDVKETIQEISFSKVSFWIQVHKLPLEMLTRSNAEKIGKILGDLEKIDDPTWLNGVGRSFLRMRIAVEIEKPLVAGFWVLREDKRRVWVEVKYEKVVDFCFVCGKMGHVMKNCERGILEMEKGEGRRRYGLWMKAAPLKEWEDEYRSKEGGGERGVGEKK